MLSPTFETCRLRHEAPGNGELLADPIAWVVNVEEPDRVAVLDALMQTRAAFAAKRPDLLVTAQATSARTGPLLYDGRETAAELRFTGSQIQFRLALPGEDTTLLMVTAFPLAQIGRELPCLRRADLVLGQWCAGMATATLPGATARIAASNQRLTEIATLALNDYSSKWATGILWPAYDGTALSLIDEPSAGTASLEFRGTLPSRAEGAMSPALADCLREAMIRQAFVEGHRTADADGAEELRLWIGGPPHLVFHNVRDPIAKLRMLSKAAPLPPDARLIPPLERTRL